MDVRPEHLLATAKERFALQDYYGCIYILEDIMQRGQAYADAYQLLGMALHMVDQRERALSALDTALSLNPRYVEAHIHRGLVLNELGRSDEASQAFDAARASGGERRDGIAKHHAAKLANHHALLGDAYAEAGAITQAIEQYQIALKLGPTFHDLRYRLARLLLEAGRTLEARDELEAVVSARPRFFEARAGLGMACYLSGDSASAETIWEQMEEQYPNDIRVKAYLALLRRGNGGDQPST